MRKSFLIGSIAALLAGCGQDTPEQRDISDCSNLRRVHDMATQFVERRLKSPSTADFGPFRDAKVMSLTPEKNSACKFLVTGQVDSQNGFGAMIRSEFTVTLSKDKGQSSWSAHDVRIY